MGKRAFPIAVVFAAVPIVALASHSAKAVGPATIATNPSPHPTSSPSSSAAPSTATPHRFLTAQDVPDYEWKFDGNLADSGRFHPRGDLTTLNVTPAPKFGLGRDGSADGATLVIGRFHDPQGAFRKEAFTITFSIFPNICDWRRMWIFADGLAYPDPIVRHPTHGDENSISLNQCVSQTDTVSHISGVHLEASFLNRKPDKTIAPAMVAGVVAYRAWSNVHIVYDGPNKLITMYVNGVKTEAPTLGAITVPGEEKPGNAFANDVLLGAPNPLPSDGMALAGNVDDFRFYSSALYPLTSATAQAHPAPPHATER